MDWSVFFTGFVASWVLCSICAIPLASTLYNRNRREIYHDKLVGTFVFWSTIVLAPFVLGVMLARIVEDHY